jgi:hypothetical protein
VYLVGDNFLALDKAEGEITAVRRDIVAWHFGAFGSKSDMYHQTTSIHGNIICASENNFHYHTQRKASQVWNIVAWTEAGELVSASEKTVLFGCPLTDMKYLATTGRIFIS